MNDTNKSKMNPFIITAICFVIIIPIVVYYFVHKYVIVPNRIFSQQQEEVKKKELAHTPKAEALAKLQVATTRVEEETKALDVLVTRGEAEKDAVKMLEAKYNSTRNLLDKQSDKLFDKAKTATPQIKINFKDSTLDDNINAMRKNVESVMSSWKNILNTYNAEVKLGSKVTNSSVSLSTLISSTENNITFVNQFIQELKSTVDSLTTTNSNLSQAQINEYKAIVNSSVSELNKITASLDSITSQSSTSSNTPVVTPSQITNQQQVVEQAQSDLAVAQAQAEALQAVEPTPEIPTSIIPDATPPAAKITNIAPGATVSYTVSVNAFANDTSGIAKVEFYSDDTLIGVDTTPQYSIVWDTTTTTDGSHELSAKAYDNTGNTTVSKLITVVVDNDNSGHASSSGDGNPPDPILIEGSNPLDS